MKQLKNWKTYLNNVNGFLRDDEASLLHSLAAKVAFDKVIVEIGSWEGKSTICLASGSRTKVYAIDPHTGSSEHQKDMGKVNTLNNFKKNISRAGVSKKVIPLVMTSHSAVKKVSEPIGLLFIDGAHDYNSVKQDFEDWFPKVIDGGIIAFHDTISWPGPRRIVQEKTFKGKYFKNVHVVGSITYGEKTNSLTLVDYFKNQYVFFMKNLRTAFVLPEPFHSWAKQIYYKVQ